MIYGIVEHQNSEDTRKHVDLGIKNGWQPLGGISLAVVQAGGRPIRIYCQAMIHPMDSQEVLESLMKSSKDTDLSIAGSSTSN